MAELIRELVIDATPETVFAFLTDPVKHTAWMGLTADLDARPGGVYDVVVGNRHRARGEFVEVVEPERLVYTFGWDAPDHPIPAGSTEVEITLAPEGSKTRLRFVHRGLPEDAVADHTEGWDTYLGRLAVVAAGGTVGPEPFAAGDADGDGATRPGR